MHRISQMNRRILLQRGALAAAGFAVPTLGSKPGQAAVPPDAARVAEVNRLPLFGEYRYAHMVQEYYVARLRRIARTRRQARAAIETPEQVMQLRAEVRQKLAACYGPRPPRTPLKPRVTGTVDRPDYRIEKVIYESRPNYLVTANLYVPKRQSGKCPAVLAPCGHSRNGKASASYQQFSRNLARQGYVVLIYDPPSQGERLEYPDRDGLPHIGFGVHSHNVAGNQMTLIGWNFALWEAWDGIRGVDYLLSRPEVDATRLGVTGNSGGGTQTTHLNALEDRFTMAAPNCFVTQLRNNLENEEPTDAEQIIPGLLAAGLDMADYFVAQIPRPTLLTGERNDFFDVRGLRATYAELRRLYTILGEQDKLALFVGTNTHGYHQPTRENMYRFFNKHAGVSASPEEPDQPVETDEVLQVTPEGQVHLLDSGRTFDFTRDAAERLAAGRARVSGAELQRMVARHLALPPRSAPPYYRVMRARRLSNRPRLDQYGFAVETEPRIVTLLHAVVKSGAVYHFPSGDEATVYVPHRWSLKEIILGQAPPVADDQIQFAVDVRGMGQLTARTYKDSGDDFFHPYHSDYMYANHGLMLNEPYAGRRAYDLLRVLDLFAARGYRRIHLVGRGMGSITATLAAIVHPVVTEVTLHNALLSYHELTQQPRYAWPLSAMVFGILKQFDLPDCLRELAASKELRIVDPWNSQMEPWPRDLLPSHLKSLGLESLA
jgi:dienelactone hydrolase